MELKKMGQTLELKNTFFQVLSLGAYMHLA